MIRAGVVGWPIAHSRSPLIHGHWLAVHGLDGRYDRIPVAPADVADFFAGLPGSGLAGVNVTLPHKEAAAAVADLDPVAARLGAANTLWLEGGRLRATNTDVHGFVANLDDRAPGWDADPRRAIVIGAGGASRAVVDGLVDRGFAVTIANRTAERAERVAALYPGRATALALHDLHRVSSDPAVGIVVNATAAGMHGDTDTLPVDLDRFGSESIVTDIVYVPLVTPFLAAAAARGLRTVDGLGMLLHQAVPGFQHWFGVRPVVTPALRSLVEADLLP